MRDSLAYWINRSWLVRYAVIVIALVAGGVIAVTVFKPHRAPHVTMSMRPAPALTTAACATQVRRFRYGTATASSLCQSGRGQTWYQAKLTNRSPASYMNCSATGFDARGKVVFTGPLLFEFGGIRGLFAPAHRSITFAWYLPRQPASPVTRYTATCSARGYP